MRKGRPPCIYGLLPSSASNRALPESRVWTVNLQRSLEAMGYEVRLPPVRTSDWYGLIFRPEGDPEAARLREAYSQRLVASVREWSRSREIVLFFAYAYSCMLVSEAVAEIAALGIPTVNFYCNAVHQFHLVEEIAPAFDFCMVPEREALAKYKGVGARPIHVQMAANPDVYRPYDLPRVYDVTFVGQCYLNRRDYVEHLVGEGCDVRVWGPGWSDGATERFGPPLSDEDLIRTYSRSKISLGFSEVADAKTGEIKRHIRLRDFEAPMSGACYLTGHQQELREYFEVGREIDTYDTKEELADKVRFYLAHPERTEAMRHAARRRCLAEHTWAHRFRDLFREIGVALPSPLPEAAAGIADLMETYG